MSQNFYSTPSPTSKMMTEQQFEEIVSAILAGKYSWACVLILQTAGYNPLHYIPYRTYNRLIKDNCLKRASGNSSDNIQPNNVLPSQSHSIRDLRYLEVLDKQEDSQVKGGLKNPISFATWFSLYRFS